MAEQYVDVSIRLSRAERDLLRALAERDARSMAAVARIAVRRYLSAEVDSAST